MMNAVLYLVKTGCQWRNLPKDFLNWKAVYIIEGVCADSAYKKHFRNIFEEFHNLKVDISERRISTFQVMPERWRIERTFS